MYILKARLPCLLYELIKKVSLRKLEVPLVMQNGKGAVYATASQTEEISTWKIIILLE